MEMKEIAIIIGHLAWPATCLIIFLILKNPLSELIRNIKSVSRSGVKFNLQKNQTNIDEPKNNFSNEERHSPLIEERVDAIKSSLDELKLPDELAQKQRVIIELALEQILRNFEQIYGIIYSSQIILLRKLNRHGSMITKKNMHTMFNAFQKEKPDPLDNFTVDTYLKFLFDAELITCSDNIFNITEKGSEYLTWMKSVGKMDKLYG